MTRALKHHWLRFSLRTLFVVIAVLCLVLSYQWIWIGQRHHALQKGKVEYIDMGDQSAAPRVDHAPWPLWLYGEPGYPSLHFNVTRSDFALTQSESVELKRMQRLFPEAVIGFSWTPAPKKKNYGGSAFDGFQL